MEKRWWNSGTDMVEKWNNDGGREEQLWWNSGPMIVERRNRDGGRVEQRNRYGGTEEQIW